MKGDGRTHCEIRAYALNKNMNGCSECDQPAACKNSETLHKMRSGALGVGLFVKTENVDRKQLLEKWIGELKGKWPHCILFLPE